MADQRKAHPNISATRANADRSDRTRDETIHIRSYDHQCAYDVHVELVDNGNTVFEERYYLQPGKTRCELRAVPSGSYELQVTLDNASHKHMTCHLGSSLEHTAVIEVGNGAFALSQGLVG